MSCFEVGKRIIDSARKPWGTSLYLYSPQRCSLYFTGEIDGGYEYPADTPFLESINELTVSAWVRPTLSGIASSQNIVNFWSGIPGFTLQVLSTQELLTWLASATYTHNGGFTSAKCLVPNVWAHIALTYNMVEGAKLIRNGEVISTSASFKDTLNGSSSTLYIGQRYSGDYGYQGYLSNLQIWTKSLSTQEVIDYSNVIDFSREVSRPDIHFPMNDGGLSMKDTSTGHTIPVSLNAWRYNIS